MLVTGFGLVLREFMLRYVGLRACKHVPVSRTLRAFSAEVAPGFEQPNPMTLRHHSRELDAMTMRPV